MPARGGAPSDVYAATQYQGMTFCRIQGGRIAERWAEIDFASLERQLKD